VKAWFHVPADGRAACGRCQRVILPGAVVLVYLGATWIKFRCATCAGEPTPSAAGLPWLPPTRAELREWRDHE
jgi:hypothetical protein